MARWRVISGWLSSIIVQKRSYTGDATIFGHRYDANYAPLTSEDGRLTGALFVAVAK